MTSICQTNDCCLVYNELEYDPIFGQLALNNNFKSPLKYQPLPPLGAMAEMMMNRMIKRDVYGHSSTVLLTQ